MVETITVLIVIFILLVGFIVYLKWQNDLQFGQWFEKVIALAPERGLTEADIQNMDEIWFWDYFLANHTPEKAMDLYLLDKF